MPCSTPGPAPGKRSRMSVLDLKAVAGSLDAKKRDGRFVEERVEQADRVGAAADTGEETVGEPAFEALHLLAGFIADDALEIADHRRIGMRAGGGADAVKRVFRRW